MANCVLTNGIPLACQDSVGGVKTVYIGAYSDTTTFTYDVDDVIDTVASTETFYTFKFRPQSAANSEEGNHSLENGTNFYTQTLTMNFPKADAAKRNVLKLLAKTAMHVIVEDNNGTYWWLGLVNGADLSASTTSNGQAFGDLSGLALTILGNEPQPMYELSATAFASLTLSA
jgi:hypothetical protein